MYPFQPNIVRQIMLDRLAGRPYDFQQFMYYHLYRNRFNVKGEIHQLRAIGQNRYRDNLGHTWEEQATWKNYFHMPFGNYVGSNLGLTTPYSRKFLRDDNETGVGGELSLIHI